MISNHKVGDSTWLLECGTTFQEIIITGDYSGEGTSGSQDKRTKMLQGLAGESSSAARTDGVVPH